MKIIWSPLAIERASEIAEYIAIDNETAALKWVDEIFNRVKQLEYFPESGRHVPEQRSKRVTSDPSRRASDYISLCALPSALCDLCRMSTIKN